MVLLAFFSGLRFGEVAAIRCSHIHFDPPRVEIIEAVAEASRSLDNRPRPIVERRRRRP